MEHVPTYLLAQQDIGPTLMGTAGAPGLFALAGGAIYAFFFNAGNSSHRFSPLRHIGTAALLIGFYLAFATFLQVVNPQTGSFYRATIVKGLTLTMHYVMPMVLFFLLAAVGVGEMHISKSSKSAAPSRR